MKYLAAVASFLMFSTLAFADSTTETKSMETHSDINRKVSPYSVSETMDKFEAIVKSKKFDVFARVDHKKNAESVDLKMADAEVIIFGNPNGGTVLMNADIRVALDLPLRVVVYQDADDKVYIAYRKPAEMTKGYDLDGHKVVGALTDGLDKLTSAAIAASSEE